MAYLTGTEVADLLSGIISAKHQCHAYETDLTVAAVAAQVAGGAVDFGGSEMKEAETREITPVKSDTSELYGWWDLDEGWYRITYNEVPRPGDDHIAFVQPHERLLLAGATHPAFYFRGQRGSLRTMVIVGPQGIRIKQNARVSKLLVVSV